MDQLRLFTMLHLDCVLEGGVSESVEVIYLESVGGNKNQAAKLSFLCNFQTNVIVYIP